MVLQSIGSTKPLLVSVSSPSITSCPEGTTHWSRSNNSTDSLFQFPLENGISNSSVDMNLLANLYQIKTESATPSPLITQTLYRTIMQQFGGMPTDPATLSQLLTALCRRFSPSDYRASPVTAAAPAPATTPAQAPNGTGTGTPSFAMTAAITSALSSNASTVGPQILPACSPLLQLAIRQALSQCLPHFTQLNIQGHLEISVGSAQTTQSATILKFNDSTSSLPASAVSLPNKSDDVNFPRSEFTVPCTSPNTSTASTGIMTFSNVADVSQDATQSSATSSSRRKSTNPIKCEVSDNVSDTLPGPDLNMSPDNTSPSIPPGRSSPISPSTDSGVLDLSRNGSLAGSAPITPMKDSLIHHPLMEPMEQTGRHQLLEAYQKQMAAFSQYHNVWNRAMLLGTLDSCVNGDAPNFTHSSSPPSNLFTAVSNGTLSAPNSPVKPVRRQRINTGCSLSSGGGAGGSSGGTTGTNHRVNSVARRPSSNRRFPCNQCREEFPSLHTLEEHTMCQHGTYRCHICKAQFTQRSNLQRHALKHVGFKPFECRVCSKAYYRKDHLMRHMEMGHPGYTPRENITVHLTSSESLDYLNRSNPQLGQGLSSSDSPGDVTLHPSPNEIADHGISMDVDDELGHIEGEVETEEEMGDDLHQSTLSHEASRHRFESTGSPHESGDSFGEDELNEPVARTPSQSSLVSESAERASITAHVHINLDMADLDWISWDRSCLFNISNPFESVIVERHEKHSHTICAQSVFICARRVWFEQIT
ncbi:unnamed protein product [Echinostoma caproni]|uniref:Zinc finger, C2H2 type n=1 Tax=Echinostoma caproni TaxID=27848 RepID=A0A183B676_9TREM|nr:unnamed protein product [Echinostoma caproni]